MSTAYILLGVCIVLWGVNWPIMKVGLKYIDPFWFSALRLLMAAATLFIVLAARGLLILPPRSDWPIVGTVSLLQFALFLACVHIAVGLVPAGRAALLAYTTPLWVVPAAILLLGEKLSWAKGAGLAVGLVGLAVLFDPSEMNWGDRNAVIGNLLLLLGAFLWGVSMIHIRSHRFSATTLQLVPWQMLIAAVPLLVVAITVEGFGGFRWGWELAAVLGYNGFVASAFTYWAVLAITRALPAITTSISGLGVPALGIAIGAVALGETVTLALLAGLALIALGLGLVAWADWRGRKRS